MGLINTFLEFIGMLIAATKHFIGLAFLSILHSIKYSHLSYLAIKGTATIENDFGQVVPVGIFYCTIRLIFWIISGLIGAFFTLVFGGAVYTFTWGIVHAMLHHS